MVDQHIKIELSAVIVAMDGREPHILVDPDMALPSGPFETSHRTLQQGLREWASVKGGQSLGYVEQLYTFADKDRASGTQRPISIGYLALVQAASHTSGDAEWSPWYRHFPWEDHRAGEPALIKQVIMPGLKQWKNAVTDKALRERRAQRIRIDFPDDMRHWNDELVLQRYELLWEAGLVQESPHHSAKAKTGLGQPMPQDHRRIVATAIARLRAKIKYRPVVFELMPKHFTLLQLQSAVEALAGLKLHKQNFRRLVEGQGLVEETGAMTAGAAGRPAKLFSFRRDVLQERAAAGTKLPKS